MRYLIILLLIVFCAGCRPSIQYYDTPPMEWWSAPKAPAVGGEDFIVKVECGKVTAVTIDMRICVTLHEARYAYVCGVEKAITRMNVDSGFESLLFSYPATAQELCICMNFLRNDSGYIDDGSHIASIRCEGGMITYSIYDAKHRRLVDIYDEPYEHAKDMIIDLPLREKKRISTYISRQTANFSLPWF